MSEIVFTQSQLSAINHPLTSKLQIQGGPGSGKTLILKQIYKRLIQDNPHEEVLILLFGAESITNFTQSKTTIPSKNLQVFTLKQFWFNILSKYLRETKNTHLIQLSEIDLRYLKNKYSSGSANQQNYLTQQSLLLYLNSFQILQTCQKYYKEDFKTFVKYMPSCKYILIDQFQDIDFISFNLIMDYYKDKIMVITGNDDQSLFSWTKMTTSNSMQKIRETFPDMEVIELEESFRCTQNILIAGESLLKPIKKRIHKKITSKNKYNRCLYLKKYSSDKKQAEQIAKQIKLLNEYKGTGFQEIGVLCRRRKLENNIIRAMKRFNIPIFRQNIGMDSQVQVILCILRLYLNRQDFMAKDIIQQYLKSNSQLCITIERVNSFVNQIDAKMSLTDIIISISKCLKLGVNRSSYTQFTRFVSSFCGEQHSLSQSMILLVRQTEIYPSNKGVSVISSLSSKGLEFKYIFVPGFNYYNYRYNSEQQENDVRKILYSTISRSSDYVCVSYFNVMCPLGLEFTKLSKKVMELEMKIEDEN